MGITITRRYVCDECGKSPQEVESMEWTMISLKEGFLEGSDTGNLYVFCSRDCFANWAQKRKRN